MIEQFLNDAAAVERMRASPVGSQLDSFAAQLTELGYARSSIRDRQWTLASLGRWLMRRGLAIADLRRDMNDAFLTRRRPSRRVRRTDAATLRLFLDHLEANAIIPASPHVSPTPISQLKAQYETYLRHDRGLSPVTGPRHWFVLRRFLNDRFPERQDCGAGCQELHPVDKAWRRTGQPSGYAGVRGLCHEEGPHYGHQPASAKHDYREFLGAGLMASPGRRHCRVERAGGIAPASPHIWSCVRPNPVALTCSC